MIDTSYHIRHRLELKSFHFAQFLPNTYRAAHRSSRSSDGLLVSNTVDDCIQGQIAQNIFKSKIEARPVKAGESVVTTWLANITFHLQPIWLQTLVVIDSGSRLTSFPSFCPPPSEVTVLFDSNLSRRPFLEQAVVDSSIKMCCFTQDSIRNMLFCSYVIFLLRDQ